MALEVYDSKTGAIHPAGFLGISTGYITKMPVWEGAASGLFCHWGAAEGAQRLAAWGMRLPTWQEYLELYKAALFIAPVTLPTVAMLRAAGVPASNQAAIDTWRDNNMSSRAWCEIHDRAVFALLSNAGWNGQPVANAGKHWCNDGAIYGWWLHPPGKGSDMIQPHGAPPVGYFHEPGRVPHVPPLGQQHDYASTCHAWAPAPTSGGGGGGGGGGIYPEATEAMRRRKLFVGGGLAVAFGGALAWLI